PGKFAIALAPLSTLIPGILPFCSNASTKLRPSRVFCRIVSSKRITPLMKSPAPFVVNKTSRYARRFSSVEGTLMFFNRFSIVPELSSAARIPFPAATSFLAIVSKFSILMFAFFSLKEILVFFLAKYLQKCKPKPLDYATSGDFLISRKRSGVRLMRGGIFQLARAPDEINRWENKQLHHCGGYNTADHRRRDA